MERTNNNVAPPRQGLSRVISMVMAATISRLVQIDTGLDTQELFVECEDQRAGLFRRFFIWSSGLAVSFGKLEAKAAIMANTSANNAGRSTR